MPRLSRRTALALALLLAATSGNEGTAREQDIGVGITVLNRYGHRGREQDLHWFGRQLGYEGTNVGGALQIAPDDKRLISLWKGTDELQSGTFIYRADALAPVRLIVSARNLDIEDAQVVGAYAKVDHSLTDLQPAIELDSVLDRISLTGSFVPFFVFKNYGWGPGRNAVLRYAFSDGLNAPPPPLSNRAKLVGDIVSEQRVDFEPDLKVLGVDVAKLKQMQSVGDFFECQALERDACLAKVRASGVFGSLAPLVSLDGDAFRVRTSGVLTYEWSDDEGEPHHRESPFSAVFLLGRLPSVVTGRSDGGGMPVPIAPNPVELRLHSRDYRLPIPFYGTVRHGHTERYEFSLHATKSSDHLLSIVLQLADGREIRSRTIHITYFVPNWPTQH